MSAQGFRQGASKSTFSPASCPVTLEVSISKLSDICVFLILYRLYFSFMIHHFSLHLITTCNPYCINSPPNNLIVSKEYQDATIFERLREASCIESSNVSVFTIKRRPILRFDNGHTHRRLKGIYRAALH